MISEASSAVQGLIATEPGKTGQKGQAQGQGGFLALLQDSSGSPSGKDGAQGLLAALKEHSAPDGAASEDLQAALRDALSGLAGQDGSGNQDDMAHDPDSTALTELQAQLDSLMQKLEDIASQGSSQGQADPQGLSLNDLLASLEDRLAQFMEADGQNREQQQVLANLQEKLSALQDSLNNNGQELDLAAVMKAHGQSRASDQPGTAMGSGQASPSSSSPSFNSPSFNSPSFNGKGAEGQQDMPQPAALREAAAGRGQEIARDGEQASRQAAVSTTTEQQEQPAQRQQATQVLSDKQAAELHEALRQAGKALQNEAATQALERNLARMAEQAGGVNRLAEALSSLQGRDEPLTSSSSSRGPESLNALSFESQLRSAGQTQQASVQAQQTAKFQGGPAADQIAMKIHKAAAAGNERISIQLNPAELGRVDVKLEFGQDGLLRAAITADRPETLDLLQRDARALERALSDAGVKTDSGSLNFNTRDTAGQRQAFDQGQDGSSASGDQRPGNGSDTGETATDTNEDAARPGYSRGLINLSV